MDEYLSRFTLNCIFSTTSYFEAAAKVKTYHVRPLNLENEVLFQACNRNLRMWAFELYYTLIIAERLGPKPRKIAFH